MRTVIFLLFIFSKAIQNPGTAQSKQDPNAEKILKEVTARYKKIIGFQADYKRESQNNQGKIQGTSKGNIVVSGSRYHLKSGSTELFCDGKIVWTADARVKEISIAEYSPGADDITPERIYTFYQNGYKYIFMGEVKSGNTVWQTIDLEPEDIEKEISKIRLFIDRKTREIRKWIIYERGSNDREEFVVEKFQTFTMIPEKELQFVKSSFPGYKVVDLR